MAKTRAERIAEDVAALEALVWGDDQKQAHEDADGILLRWAPPKIREAWQQAADRTQFWDA